MATKREIQRLKNSRKGLLRAISELSEAQLNRVSVEGTWTTKEVIGHICGWDTTVSRPLAVFLQRGEFNAETITDHDAWNARQTDQRKDKSFSEVLAEAEATREELLQLAGQLAEEDWEQQLPIPWGGEGTLAQMIYGLAWHEDEHARKIAALVNRGTST